MLASDFEEHSTRLRRDCDACRGAWPKPSAFRHEQIFAKQASRALWAIGGSFRTRSSQPSTGFAFSSQPRSSRRVPKCARRPIPPVPASAPAPVLELAACHGFMIVKDDIYGDLHGRHATRLARLDVGRPSSTSAGAISSPSNARARALGTHVLQQQVHLRPVRDDRSVRLRPIGRYGQRRARKSGWRRRSCRLGAKTSSHHRPDASENRIVSNPSIRNR